VTVATAQAVAVSTEKDSSVEEQREQEKRNKNGRKPRVAVMVSLPADRLPLHDAGNSKLSAKLMFMG